jgi:hypothetical protein
MKTIKVDEVVYERLQRDARPFEDTPNTVLRRLLGIDPDNRGAGGDHPLSTVGTRADPNDAAHRDTGADVFSSVPSMRQAAVDAVEAALALRAGKPVTLRQENGIGNRSSRGPREQRFRTPGGQVIYVRTRTFDAAKLPFFTLQPSTLADADWYVFVCGGRGDVVMPGDEVRRLAPGLHRDGGGDYKPTFIVDGTRCEVYAFGEPVSIARSLNAYEAIASSEPGSRSK